MLNLYPGFIDNTNFKYLNIDGKYIATVYIISYPQKLYFLQLMKNIPRDISFDMSIFIKKQDTLKVLKEITYNISNSKAEINTINKNQIDVDILDKITSDSKKLRHEIQINNEEIYNIDIYITLNSNSEKEILYKIKKLRNILYSKMLGSNILNFRHLQGYLSTLPLHIIDNNMFKNNCINMTTSNIVNLFPFYTETVFDKKGILFGYTLYDNKICNIDMFNEKYNNANMCVFGSSGSGKSYFIKLLILRHYINNINQYIFDLEGEYVKLSYQIGESYISFDNNSDSFLNILDIYEFDIKENNFLDKKVDCVYEILSVFLNINNEYKMLVLNAIKEVYINKGITNEIDSMYKNSDKDEVYINKTIKNKNDMPLLEDIYKLLKLKYLGNQKFKSFLLDFEALLKKYSFLNKKTTINFNNKLIVFNLISLEPKVKDTFFDYIIEKIIKKISNSNEKSLIYIDEVWKFIYNNSFSAERIFMLYKTIRKLNAGIVTITQDISDFFNKDLGVYGKSIINNSFIKAFFKMEYSDSEIFKKLGILDSFKLNEIIKLNKANVSMLFQNNLISLNIKANEYEKKLIKEEHN